MGKPKFRIDIRMRDWVWRHYPNDRFSNLATLPNENALEVNVTHEQLTSLSNGFKKQVALAPTRYEEGATNSTKTPDGKGYDIKLEAAKEIVFQHKAPAGTRVIGPGDDKIQWLKYEVNMTQVYNLVLQYAPGEAFLALPATPQQLHIREGLSRTVFVDVYAVFLHTLQQREETSWIYVEYLPKGRRMPHVIGKFNTQKWSMKGLDKPPYYHLHDRTSGRFSLVYSWQDLEEHIERCDYGLPIRSVRPQPLFDSFDFDRDDIPGEFDDLPEGFDEMEDLLGEFDPDYIDHLERRYALNAYANTEDKETRELYRVILTKSLENRLRMGHRQERLLAPGDVRNLLEYFPEDKMDDSEQWTTLDIFRPFKEAGNPLIKGLSGNCRSILEKGNADRTVTI